MCISSATHKAMTAGMIKKMADLQKKPEEPKQSQSKQASTSMPKQKRRVRPSRLMRSGSGNRSFLEGGQ